MKTLINDILKLVNHSKIRESISGNEWPIFSSVGNKIINRRGEESQSFELIARDLDQLSRRERDLYILSIRDRLNRMDSDYFYKFLLKGNRIYVNTTDPNPRFPQAKLVPLDNPLSVHFHNGQIYGDPFFGPDYYKLNGSYFRILSFEENSFSETEIDPEAFAGCDQISVQFLKRNSGTVESNLMGKETSHNFVKNNIGLDVTSDEAAAELNYVRREIAKKEESLFYAQTNLFVEAKTLEELTEKTMFIIDQLEDRGHQPYFETFALQDVFTTTLFGVRPNFSNFGHALKTSVLSNILPLSVDKIHSSGTGFLTESGNHIFLDLLNAGNGLNAMFTGPTGAGKGVTARDILWDYLDETDIKVIIVEFGDSSERMVKWHGGKSFNSKIPILMFKDDPHFLQDVFLSLVDPEKDPVSTVDRGKIFERIQKGTEEDAFNSIDSFIDFMSDGYEDFRYYFSEVREYLCDDSSLSISERLIHVDIKYYPKRMKKIVISFIMKWFQSRDEKTLLLIDELYKMVKKREEVEGEFIAEFLRTERKEGKYIWLITQGLDEREEIAYFDTMNQMSDINVSFKEKEPVIDLFTPADREAINSLHYEEVTQEDVGTNRSEVKCVVIGPGIRKRLIIPKKLQRFYVLNTDKEFKNDWKRWNSDQSGKYISNFRENINAFMVARGENV